MLSGFSKTTLYKVFSCAMLSQEILFGQYYTEKNPMQCCPRGSKQHCTGNNSVQCCLSTAGIALHKYKLYTVLYLRLQTAMYRKKNLFNVVLILMWQNCSGQNSMQYCLRGCRQHYTWNKSGNVVWKRFGRSVYIHILGPSRYKKI